MELPLPVVVVVKSVLRYRLLLLFAEAAFSDDEDEFFKTAQFEEELPRGRVHST